jgi:glycosyltransferase involved in cell wall biosynthesis
MVERTFPAGSVVAYEAGDADALAQAVIGLVDDPSARERAITTTLDRVRELSWEREADKLVRLVDRLDRDGRSDGLS